MYLHAESDPSPRIRNVLAQLDEVRVLEILADEIVDQDFSFFVGGILVFWAVIEFSWRRAYSMGCDEFVN